MSSSVLSIQQMLVKRNKLSKAYTLYNNPAKQAASDIKRTDERALIIKCYRKQERQQSEGVGTYQLFLCGLSFAYRRTDAVSASWTAPAVDRRILKPH